MASAWIISGSFTNGLTRDVGQIALAKFANNAGLVDLGNGRFNVGPNSGPAIITKPFGFGTGRVIGGALELSNVANLPITLYPGMKIGQISFLTMSTPADVPYGSDRVGSKYQDQIGPIPSRYWENFDR